MSDSHQVDENRSLDEIHAGVWDSLEAAALSSGHAWRLPVLATVSGEHAHARTVVLRAANGSDRSLVVHTDRRSPKVDQINQNANVCLVFYDPASLLQLSVTGTAQVHSMDAVADANWDDTPASSRRAYLGELAPGLATDEPNINLPEHVRGRVPSEEELAPARINFAVVGITVSAIDCLKLDRDGNLRAQFRYAAHGDEFTWVAP